MRDGQPVALAPKAVDILLMLVQHAGHLVDKDELMKQVWTDAFVEEGNLTKNIFFLRRVLGTRDDGGEYIDTVPKRGYRFAAPVEKWLEEQDRTEVVSEGPSRNQTRAAEPRKIERIDRGKGYALARQPEPIRKTPSEAEATAPTPAVPVVVPRQEPREASGSDLKGRRSRLIPGVAAALTVVAVLAVVWVLSPAPVPRVRRTLQLTHFGRVEALARLLTDGTSIFFVQKSGGHYSLAQIPVEGGEPVPIATLFPNTALLDISPDHSELLVSSVAAGEEEGALWALPTAGGSLRRLGNVSAQDAAWSPDGRKILYAAGSNLYVMKANGLESRRLASTPGFPHYPRWSPDGRVLRFTLSDLPSHTESLWEVTSEGGNLHRLLPGWRESSTDWGDGESGGDWTPDGKYFVFRSVRAHAASIWAIREKGGFLRRSSSAPSLLTTTDSYLWSTSVAGAGKKLVFGAGKEDRELERYDSRLNQFVPYLLGVSARWASFSNDGRWVAYVAMPGFVLWRSRLDGSERLRLTFPPARSGAPRWSPDGKHIATVGISIIPADGGNPEVVTPGDDPDWSPDGDTLLFSTHDATIQSPVWAIQRIELKTRQVSTLSGSQGLRAPAYSPDGRHVAAISASPANRLMLFDIYSQRWTELARATWLHVPPYWSRDGRYVYAQDLGGVDQPVFRVRISDHKREVVATLKQFARADATAYSLAGLTPDGEPLASLLRSSSDIYALDVDFP